MLIAAIRSGGALAGKAVSYSEDDGKLWLTGVGQIDPSKLLEYDAAGQVEWADDATRSWVVSLAGGDAGSPRVEEPAGASGPAAPPASTSPTVAAATTAASRTAPEGAPDDPVGRVPSGGSELEPDDEASAAIADEGASDAPIAVTAAQHLRRGRQQRPEFVESKSRGWRPSELQQKTLLYLVVGIVMVAIVVVLAVWGAGRGGDGDEPLEGNGWTVVMELDGAATTRSEEFDLGSGRHRLDYSVEFVGLTTSSYDICVVPVSAAAGTERDFSVARGSLSTSATQRTDSVVFDARAGTYVLQVFVSDCTWKATVFDDR
jgi:hypothetical protein